MFILQADLKHLASDREAVTKQREKLRAERLSLIERLDTLKEQQSRQLAETAGFEQELSEAHEEQNGLRLQIEALANERATLGGERDRLAAERQALEMERDGLLARFEGDRERLQQLGVDGVGALTRMIDELSEGRESVERELNETRTQLASTEDRLEMLQIRASSIQTQIVYRPDNPDMFLSMIEELRTPMTSVVGYVDLILNESAGILGEMQRKFMMRVASNVSRLAMMLDDLVRLSYLDTGRFRLERQPIDVIEIIEDAITASSPQMREKGLSLSLDLEDEAEPLTVDKDAITQVIGQLLTNAYLVSPPNSEIVIRARREATTRHSLKTDGDVDYGSNGHRAPVDALIVSISDQGGGILPEDMPRAFARKYKAENPLIQGLGDTGVGLALARALVEAHGGEVWLETATGVGTQFTFTLPYAAMPLVQIPHWEEE